VLLDRRHSRGRLAPSDLEALRFVPAWTSALSGLWCRPAYPERLRAVADSLPLTTTDPLDSAIPAHWPWTN